MEFVNVLGVHNDEVYYMFIDRNKYVNPESVEELEANLEYKEPYYDCRELYNKDNIVALFIRLKNDTDIDSLYIELIMKEDESNSPDNAAPSNAAPDDIIPDDIIPDGNLPTHVMYSLMAMLASTHKDKDVIYNGTIKKEKISDNNKLIMDNALKFMEGDGKVLVQTLYYTS